MNELVWFLVAAVGFVPVIVVIVCLLTGDWDVFDRRQR